MKKIIIILTWIISFVLIILNILLNPTSFFANGTILFGWLLLAVQLTWSQSEFFYMFIKRIWFYIKNPDCNWNMIVDFDGEFTEDIFNKIDQVFSNQSKNYKIITLSTSRKLYKLGSLSFEINIENNKRIVLQMQDIEISYRRSITIVENELGVLFENLSKVIKEDKSDYYLNINFKEYNPYFGFFVRRLKSKEITTFNVKFNVESDRVTVNKDSIEVYTTSIQQLRTFSKQYLTLSPR